MGGGGYLQITYLTKDSYLEYKNISQTSQEINNPIRKLAKGIDKHFTKDIHRRQIRTEKMLTMISQ